jgi:hypothetical protein
MQCPKCRCTRLKKNGMAGSGRQRWTCADCNHRTTNPHQEQADSIVTFPDKIPQSKKYIFTAAQNATPAHKGFLSCLKIYAAHIKAKLIIIPFRYKNPTSQWSADNESHEWWAAETVQYLYDGRFDLNENLSVLADIKTQPTAVDPLTGLEGISGSSSCIVGHPKITLRTVPTPGHLLPKIMASTGAVTVENYTDTKAGKKGEFHHTLGAIVVELDGKRFHQRHILGCKDGSFIDLDKSVSRKGVVKAPPMEALIMGDTHVDFVDPDVTAATFGKGGMCQTLKPKNLLWHDLLDFHSANWHHRGNPFIALAKHQSGMGDVKAEVERACKFVKDHTPRGCKSVLVPSNHPEGLSRWVKETDWRNTSPENMEFYLETALAVVKSTKMTKNGTSTIDPFLYWADKMLDDVVLMDRSGSFVVGDHELGMHGDKGANGARGNIKQFARIGPKTFIGHSHSPGWFEGAKQVGTSSYLHLDYNAGLSSWMQTHGGIYANGKPVLINIIEGEWRC